MHSFLRNLIITSLFCLSLTGLHAQRFDIQGPPGSEEFGKEIIILANGNYVVSDPLYSEGTVTNVGAVYLFNGQTHSLISTLKGSSEEDRIGFYGIVALPNSNFVVLSPTWTNGSPSNQPRGAATLVNGTTGLSGVVSSINSLVGAADYDAVGIACTVLSNGNYVISSPGFNHNVNGLDLGAITWCSATIPTTGVVSASNSVIGTFYTDVDAEKMKVTPLTNGNYVISYLGWGSGAGAVTWCNGTTGRTGFIDAGNAMIGNVAGQKVGNEILPLANGNYVVFSKDWNSPTKTKVGAVTWCNGTTGTIGVVQASNSFTGTKINDRVGDKGGLSLPNGKYVVFSQFWSNGSVTSVGAATLLDGIALTSDTVSVNNSLVGSQTNDRVGMWKATLLTNGNYVVNSSSWNNGTAVRAGAITWCNGNTGLTGPVTSSNSLVGSKTDDYVGQWVNVSYVTALTNGHYVVCSPMWDNAPLGSAGNDVGAATWCNGSTGRTGPVSAANSLIGATATDQIGYNGAVALTNGNYVVGSEVFNYPGNNQGTKIGAVVWCDGSAGRTGTVNFSNSIYGTSKDDRVGRWMHALSNGNYVVHAYNWRNYEPGLINYPLPGAGAVTWGNGFTGTTGGITALNSLVGVIQSNGVGKVYPLTNGNYVVHTIGNKNGTAEHAGAITMLDGTRSYAGVVNSCNSVEGTVYLGGQFMSNAYNYTYNYLIVGRPSENKITITDSVARQMAQHQDQGTITLTANSLVPVFSANSCRIMSTLYANGSTSVNGSVTFRTWIEPAVFTHNNVPVVARHQQVSPASSTATSTARLTFYYTQQEFNDFNNHSGSLLDLPAFPGDANGIANLRIVKYSGASSDGTGLPGSYTGTPVVIDPNDADVIWDAGLNAWEVTFDVTGFSGFFVQTSTGVIPLTLLDFTGRYIKEDALILWNTSNEINSYSFEIERSRDGIQFVKAGVLSARNTAGDHSYAFVDSNVAKLNAPVLYYRLKQVDINGTFKYSGIVALKKNRSQMVTVFPNPVKDKANIYIHLPVSEKLQTFLLDNTGRVIRQFSWFASTGSNTYAVDLKELSVGIYYIWIKGTGVNERLSLIKQ